MIASPESLLIGSSGSLNTSALANICLRNVPYHVLTEM